MKTDGTTLDSIWDVQLVPKLASGTYAEPGQKATNQTVSAKSTGEIFSVQYASRSVLTQAKNALFVRRIYPDP